MTEQLYNQQMKLAAGAVIGGIMWAGFWASAWRPWLGK